MANELHVKHSGSWVQPKEVHIRHSGSWRNCRQVWVKQGGSWLWVFGLVPDSTQITIDDVESSGTAIASATFDASGNITTVGNGSDPSSVWYSPTQAGIGNNYWIKFEVNFGSSWSNTGTITAGTVYALSTARTVEWTRSVLGANLGSANVRIYSDSGGTNEVAFLQISANAEII